MVKMVGLWISLQAKGVKALLLKSFKKDGNLVPLSPELQAPRALLWDPVDSESSLRCFPLEVLLLPAAGRAEQVCVLF